MSRVVGLHGTSGPLRAIGCASPTLRGCSSQAQTRSESLCRLRQGQMASGPQSVAQVSQVADGREAVRKACILTFSFRNTISLLLRPYPRQARAKDI